MPDSDEKCQINEIIRFVFACFSPSGCHLSLTLFTVFSLSFRVKTQLKSTVPCSAPHTAAGPARFGFGQTDMSE